MSVAQGSAGGLRVAVQMDPLEPISIDGDSTFALMLEAQARGHLLWHYEVRQMSLREGKSTPGAGRTERLPATARPVQVRREPGRHYSFGEAGTLDLASMDVVLMRQDPPFDMGYITATHMLEHIVPRDGQPGTLVVNDPAHVRNAPEKLLVTHFPDLMPPTLVTWDADAIRSSARSTLTSSSSRCSAMAAPACSASSRTTRTWPRCWRCTSPARASR